MECKLWTIKWNSGFGLKKGSVQGARLGAHRVNRRPDLTGIVQAPDPLSNYLIFRLPLEGRVRSSYHRKPKYTRCCTHRGCGLEIWRPMLMYDVGTFNCASYKASRASFTDDHAPSTSVPITLQIVGEVRSTGQCHLILDGFVLRQNVSEIGVRHSIRNSGVVGLENVQGPVRLK
jgi:hypothetical protein